MTRFIALLLTLASGALACSASAQARTPNMIIILADDMGAADWEGGGSRFIRTPNLNAMAREGVRLTQFFASANVCTPSRAALLTGRYAVRSGLARGVIFPHSTYGLPAGEVTIPELLKSQGYATKLIGKWHLGTDPASHPLQHGFDGFFGTPYSNDMTPFPLIADHEVVEAEADQTLLTQKYTAAAVDFIRLNAKEERPFFLLLAHNSPHIPLFASPRFAGKSAAGRYGDTIEEIDWSVGEIRSALRREGIERETLIIFTSDNGPWFEGDSGSRGRKGDTYQGAYHVPMIAAFPGTLPSRKVSAAMTMQIDLLPTLAGLAGVKLPDDRPIDGRDIISVLRGAQKSPHEHLIFFEEDRIAAIRTERWRFVTLSFYRSLLARLEQIDSQLLFDLQTHGAELYNVADAYPETVASFRDLLARLRSEFEGLPQKVTEPRLRSQ
jgi:uncharacterized sulfatase